MPDTPILTDSAAVSLFAAELHRETVIAVDLEADSMHCYQEKVCLLQFSTPARTVLVDPLAAGDLSSLRPVFADPGVRKLFHAADYDIRCLFRDFALEVRGLFDTMIASQFLGEEKVGLADVLGKSFGVVLDKQYQRADWAQRPLSAEMIRYAAEDTRHLHRLAVLLEEKLAAKGRLAWVAEEFALLEQARFAENGGNPFFLRVKGAGLLDRRQLAVLEALLQWRDAEARHHDRPPFKVLGTKPLLELSRTAPQHPQGLEGIEGLPSRLVERYGRQLLQAIENGLAVPAEQLPRFPRGERRERDPAADARLARLKEWRRQKAAALEMDPGIVINNALLEEVARRVPVDEPALAEVPGLKNWQRRELGAELLATIG
jgi:ribonuclease D